MLAVGNSAAVGNCRPPVKAGSHFEFTPWERRHLALYDCKTYRCISRKDHFRS